jgi:hypothetical protein
MAARWCATIVLAALLVPAPALASRPNLERVTVSRSADQRVTFRIEFARPVELRHDTTVQIAIDADRDPATGIDGLDYSLDWTETVLSSADVKIPDELEGELRDMIIRLGESYSLLTAIDGEAVESHPHSLKFSHNGDLVTFSIAAADIGDAQQFDFYAFIEQGGALDEAPSHVLFSAGASPWTYPQDGIPARDDSYPTQTYEDPTDATLSENTPLFLVVVGAVLGAVLGIGALLAIAGWGVERYRSHGRPASGTRSQP